MDPYVPLEGVNDDLPHAVCYRLRQAKVEDVHSCRAILFQMGRRRWYARRIPPACFATNQDLALVGFNVFCGMFLAELTLDSDIQNYAADHNFARSLGSTSLVIVGLFFMSYPEENPSWARWSQSLDLLGDYIFPTGVEYARYYPGLGVNLLTLGVIFNNTAKKLLSHHFFCWLGKLSFPIYLLHAPLIRTVLTWALFGASTRPDQGKDEEGNQLEPGWLPIANRWVCLMALPLFYIFLYRVANLWATHVDPFCGRVTNWFEELVFRDDAKASSEKPLLLS